jgi:hypothetical protein
MKYSVGQVQRQSKRDFQVRPPSPPPRPMKLGLVVAVVACGAVRAQAGVNLGADAGVVMRDMFEHLPARSGLVLGLHGDLDLRDRLSLGGYFLHGRIHDRRDDDDPFRISARFDTFGIRMNAVLIEGGGFRAVASIGAGYTLAGYDGRYVDFDADPAGPLSGHFIETPLGLGLSHSMGRLARVSLDVAYRPGFAFGGDAYEVPESEGRNKTPRNTGSLMLGVAFGL